MHRLVTIDLQAANLALFETYEAAVLPLLSDHGARLEMRVRTLDGAREIHLLQFPDARAYQAYLDDPRRLAAQAFWRLSGAVSAGEEVEAIR